MCVGQWGRGFKVPQEIMQQTGTQLKGTEKCFLLLQKLLAAFVVLVSDTVDASSIV